jgi:probable DNA metabolism protein
VERITFAPNFASWQKAARHALRRALEPDELIWQELGHDEPVLDLFEEAEAFSGAGAAEGARFHVPKRFFNLAQLVALHRDERRWALLYRLVWRLTRGEPKLLEIVVDPEVSRAYAWHKSVRHDIHKMRAFVRFREITQGHATWFVAWFEPQHHIVEHNARFFVDRFASMRWSILTPDRCAHWNGSELAVTEGVERSMAPSEDQVERLWLTYYRNIFNPARVKEHAMQAEMPKKYWRNLPETAVIPELLREAPARVDAMMKKSAAKSRDDKRDDWKPAPVPETSSVATLAKAARSCTACPLYRDATQTVFGEGPKAATFMLLGEQPGDQEDLAGKPFVGPAGKLLDRALDEAGIERGEVYVTNTVKHFKWEPRGKRRIHQKPNSREIAACRPWLEAELRLVRPKLLICLGATAAQSILGLSFRVTRERGKVLKSELAPRVLATVHPSSLLRQPDEESREREYAKFVDDLRAARKSVAAR